MIPTINYGADGRVTFRESDEDTQTAMRRCLDAYTATVAPWGRMPKVGHTPIPFRPLIDQLALIKRQEGPQ